MALQLLDLIGTNVYMQRGLMLDFFMHPKEWQGLDQIILSFRKPFLSFYIYLLLIWLFMFILIFLCCFFF
jgi:hypothetical protein